MTCSTRPAGSSRICGVGRRPGRVLLEIVVKDADDETEPEIIHAMLLRRSFYRYP